MSVDDAVYSILEDLTGEDFRGQADDELFDSGMLDSMDTVQLLLSLQDQLDIIVPISDFDREAWNTPAKMIAQVQALQA